ncbi:hypothetical protein VCR17J2_420035 [Vibrio coralliirubri]|nr:hypothetical protein VCR17J2_420035 [Vibrio coralliirubri]
MGLYEANGCYYTEFSVNFTNRFSIKLINYSVVFKNTHKTLFRTAF